MAEEPDGDEIISAGGARGALHHASVTPSMPRARPSRTTILAAALIVLAALAVYGRTFSVPFLLDDPSSIAGNDTIQHGWLNGRALFPPHEGQTVEGRPFLNLSLAFNYAISGSQGWSYHAVNLVIHALAGLALFGVVRRTLLLPRDPPAGSSWRRDATWLALLAAICWVVHPLQTESVTYVIQRAESLMGLCYLLTMYFFIRASQVEKPARWFGLALVTCVLGMATKEVMVTAPLLVWLYDRTFLAGSFREAWRQRGRWYVALAGTWLVLALLVIGAGNRGGTIGASAGVAWWEYALTQIRAVPHYLRLALWPAPLVFDYGPDFVHRAGPVIAYAMLDAILVTLTLWGLVRRTGWGFLGAWFFLLLAPSSSVVGGTRQMMAEHRIYLSLAAVIVLAGAGLYAALGRRGLAVGFAAALALGWTAVQRNEDYRSALAIWSDTVAKRPENPWAHGNLGTVLLAEGRPAEATAEFERALAIKPDYAEAHNNLGNILLRRGQVPAAVDHFQQALRARPGYAGAHGNLANALLQIGRRPEAMAHYQESLRLDPAQPEVHNNVGNALAAGGHLPEAIAHYDEALRLDPDYAEAHDNLGNALCAVGRKADAIGHYQAALRLKPDAAPAEYDFANVLADSGRLADAVDHYRRALALNPDYAEAHNNLGNALLKLTRVAESAAQYEAAVRLQPANAVAHYNLANALLRLGHVGEAIAHDREALRLQPNFAEARQVLFRLGIVP